MTLLCAGEAVEDRVLCSLDRLPALGEAVKIDHFTATIGGGALCQGAKGRITALPLTRRTF